MFRRILIANRGEVAARVMRTCGRLGIETVAVCSRADRELSYLELADEVVEHPSPRVYLDAGFLVATALERRCSALHPGWGFLAENATFAARCEAARVAFLGPSPAVIRRMGDKAAAREAMRALGLPPVPGSDGPLEDLAAARAAAEAIGTPLLLKAVAGGGGRGMRLVRSPDELEAAFAEATAEARSAFGDGRLYAERYVERARHVEFQVLGDGRTAVVLGARDCSVQRRHQKLVEETPVPGLSEEGYRRLAERVARACAALGYRSAGTVEMLAEADEDGRIDADRAWFMEMNTRLQVEHPVTEEVTGIDLVEWQLRVAANHLLSRSFEGGPVLVPEGHAIEFRVNAEDPAQGFRPVPGRLRRLELPAGEGVRVDTHLRAGDRIPPHYDSLLAKVIARGRDRAEAVARLRGALEALVVEGVPTTVPAGLRVLSHPDFLAARHDTAWLERTPEVLS